MSAIDGLDARIRRLEDRVLISELVIRYAVSVDRKDWVSLATCFTDPVHVDFSELGVAAGMVARADQVAGIAAAIGGFAHTQHLSPNHVIEFDENDLGRATCHSYLYAQHLLEGSADGDFYLLRGSYINQVVRTADGWRIEGLIAHVAWEEGNVGAVAESSARTNLAAGA
jgi:hypothetical protein